LGLYRKASGAGKRHPDRVSISGIGQWRTISDALPPVD
jgi:hypothetical protein